MLSKPLDPRHRRLVYLRVMWRVWMLQVVTQAVDANYFWLVSKIRLYLLAPELIHASEGTGILLLELMPQRQVTSIRVFPKKRLKFSHNICAFKAAKPQTQLIQTLLNLRERKAMLLHMK